MFIQLDPNLKRVDQVGFFFFLDGPIGLSHPILIPIMPILIPITLKNEYNIPPYKKYLSFHPSFISILDSCSWSCEIKKQDR